MMSAEFDQTMSFVCWSRNKSGEIKNKNYVILFIRANQIAIVQSRNLKEKDFERDW